MVISVETEGGTTGKVLLVGSSFSAAPIFFALKKKKHHITVCGSDQTDPCHQYADASIFIDYSDRDALLEVVTAGAYDYLVPTCNDYSYMAATWVAAQQGFFGYDSYDTALTLHNKVRFRAFMAEAELPAPRSVSHHAGTVVAARDLVYPLLVKPSDSFSGRGTTKIDTPGQLKAALEFALSNTRAGSATIEEFIKGSLHSHSAFLCGQQIVQDFFVDEFCTVYPYQVNCSNHPSALCEAIRTEVRGIIGRLAARLGLADGLLHTQFMVGGGRVWIIECMRRCPGDLYGQFVGTSVAVDYADLYIRPFLGLELPDTLPAVTATPMSRHSISTATPTVVFGFSHDLPARSVRFFPLKSSGKKLNAAPYDKLAVLFAEFTSLEEMLEVTPHMDRYITFYALDRS